jgi:hypothetical protein
VSIFYPKWLNLTSSDLKKGFGPVIACFRLSEEKKKKRTRLLHLVRRFTWETEIYLAVFSVFPFS